MSKQRMLLTATFLGGLFVLAAFSLLGVPLIPADAWATLAAAGAMPMTLTGELGGDIRKTLEEIKDKANSAKDVVESVRKAHEALDGRVAKIHEEMKAGMVDATTKAAYQDTVETVSKVEKKLEQVTTELAELAKKSTNMLGGGGDQKKSLGQLVAASEECKSYKGGTLELAAMNESLFRKAAITSAAASAGPLIQPHRAEIVMGAELPLSIRDLFQQVSIATNSVEWVAEKVFTNNAGSQPGEGTAYGESGLTFEKKSSPVETLGHWIPISRQVLSDAGMLQGLVDGKLRYGLKLKEEGQILFGDGTNGTLHGLVPQSTAFSASGMPTVASGGVAHTRLDYLRWAFLQVARAGYPATFAALSLEDWATIQMMKTTDGAYIFGTPTDGAAPRVWGKQVVESHALTVGDFLAGSGFAATLYDREEVSVRVAEQHADFAIKNMVALICDERLAFTVERKAAIVSGDFAALMAPPQSGG